MKLTLPTVYSQFDEKWSKILLGTNTDPKFNIYNYGCLLSSLATVLTYYGKNETPFTLNDKLKGAGGFVNGGQYVHQAVTKLYPDVTERVVVTPNLLTDAQVKEIKDALYTGNPVIFKIDYNPKTVLIDTHFVAAVGYNPKDENDFLIADPLGGVVKSLKSYLGWLKPNARKSIEKYMIMSGPVPQPKVEDPAPTPAAPVAEPAAPQPPLEPTPATQPIADVVHSTAADVPTPTPPVVGNDHWARLVEYLEIGKDPNDATYEDAKRVIAGHKSAKTDYSNKMTAALTRAAEAEVTIKNLQGEIDILKQEAQTTAKAHKAEVDALNTNRPSLEKYQEQVKAMTADMQATIAKQYEEIKQLRLEKAKLEAEEEAEAQSEGTEPAQPTIEDKSTAPKNPSVWKRLLWLHW